MGTTLFLIFVAIILIFLWLRVDFKLGFNRHLKKIEKREYPLRQSNIELFIYGGKLFKDYFAELKAAKEHIHILFYIIKNDPISKEFFEILKTKASEGIEIRVLVDWVGGKEVSKKEIQSLIQGGVQFEFCHKPRWPYLFYSLNERNHRKITVVDGKIGYVGGFNIGNEYIGHNPTFGNWRDYHLKLIGEGVQDLQTQFLLDWQDATGDHLLHHKKYFPSLAHGKILHKFIPTDGGHLKERLYDIIDKAKQEIIIGTPYFIPGNDILEKLLGARERGVDIKILVPMKADHPFVKEAAFPYFKTLIKTGCEIYRFYYGFYHAKVIMIDGNFCDIGTANFDKRSMHLNHEINCFIYDTKFSEQVRQQLLSDINKAEAFTLEELQNRSIFQKSKDSFSTLISDLL